VTGKFLHIYTGGMHKVYDTLLFLSLKHFLTLAFSVLQSAQSNIFDCLQYNR